MAQFGNIRNHRFTLNNICNDIHINVFEGIISVYSRKNDSLMPSRTSEEVRYGERFIFCGRKPQPAEFKRKNHTHRKAFARKNQHFSFRNATTRAGRVKHREWAALLDLIAVGFWETEVESRGDTLAARGAMRNATNRKIPRRQRQMPGNSWHVA